MIVVKAIAAVLVVWGCVLAIGLAIDWETQAIQKCVRADNSVLHCLTDH